MCWQGKMYLGTLEVSLRDFDEELCSSSSSSSSSSSYKIGRTNTAVFGITTFITSFLQPSKDVMLGLIPKIKCVLWLRFNGFYSVSRVGYACGFRGFLFLDNRRDWSDSFSYIILFKF